MGPTLIDAAEHRRPANLTVEELADEFRTTPETIHYWVKTGKAPASFKVGRRRLFARADVDTWLEAAKAAGSGTPAA